MALENLISVTFGEDDLQVIDNALAAIEAKLTGKVIAIMSDERKRYGRVADGTEPWLIKIKNHAQQTPNFNPVFVDVEEYNRDLAARLGINPRLERLNNLVTMLEDTNILLGFDLYQNALAYYRNVKLLAGQNVPGAKTIAEDLSTQFPGRPKGVKKTE